MKTTISIIVTSYTTERLKDTMELLDSIAAQSYPDIETVFVAERSRELCEFVKDYADKHNVRNLKMVFNDGGRGLSAARNTGIKEGKGEIIAFVDDDAVLSPQWAAETVKAYARDDSIIGLTGPILPLWEEPSLAWFPQEFYWIFACTYYDWTEPRKVRNGYGTNISFKREAFEQGGLFPSHLGSERSSETGEQKTTAEETELSLRIRRKTGKYIEYNPKIIVNHKVHKFRLSRQYIWKRAFIEGLSKVLIRRAYKDNPEEEKLLKTEYELLKRIFLKLFPDILRGFFTNPVIAWRRLSVTVVVLLAVASGYISYPFKSSSGKKRYPESNQRLMHNMEPDENGHSPINAKEN